MMSDPALRKAMGGLQEAMKHAGSSANVYWDVDETGATPGQAPSVSAPPAEDQEHPTAKHEGAAGSDTSKEDAALVLLSQPRHARAQSSARTHSHAALACMLSGHTGVAGAAARRCPPREP